MALLHLYLTLSLLLLGSVHHAPSFPFARAADEDRQSNAARQAWPLPTKSTASVHPSLHNVLDLRTVTKYLDLLPIPEPYLLGHDTETNCSTAQVTIRDSYHQFHQEIPPTYVWAFDGLIPGPFFDVKVGECLQVQWKNELNDHRHFLPVDRTITRATGTPNESDARIVIHMHGPNTADTFDGFPGQDIEPGLVFNTTYRNEDLPGLYWYHDHSVGITRLNVYAGLAGIYVLRSDKEKLLNLPNGEFEIPLVIMDKSFYQDGSLHYPSYPNLKGYFPYPEEYRLGTGVIGDSNGINSKDGDRKPNTLLDQCEPPPYPSVVQEYFPLGILVNGKLWPRLEVKRKLYRFRLLCATDARPMVLRLETSATSMVLPFIILGEDVSFFSGRPLVRDNLQISPAQRADLLIDFSAVTDPDDQFVYLRNYGPDYTHANPDTAGQVMRFDLLGSVESRENFIPTGDVPVVLRDAPHLESQEKDAHSDTQKSSGVGCQISLAAPLKSLTLSSSSYSWDLSLLHKMSSVASSPVALTENWMTADPKSILDALPTNFYLRKLLIASPADITSHLWQKRDRFCRIVHEIDTVGGWGVDPVIVPVNRLILWDFINNTTMDHPMHIHQGPFRVVAAMKNNGHWEDACAADMGWRDTVNIPPFSTVRIAKVFELTGNYVFHCHILTHEDYSMMKQLQIVSL